MKTVLIITSRSEKTVAWKEREKYVQDFCKLVESQSSGLRVIFTTYRDLEYRIVNGEASIVDTLNGMDLKEAALIHFKNWQYETGEAPVIAAYLKSNGVSFYNSEVHIPIAPGKLAQMFYLGSQGIPVPDTFYSSKERLLNYFRADRLPVDFVYPLIMKANDGSRGDDNHLIRSSKEAVDVLTAADPEKQYVLQKFIPNDGDYRFLFIGLDEPPLVFHRTAVSGSHLNNTSKGGSGKFINLKEVPSKYVNHAWRAASLVKREIGGVDILVDKNTGKDYVLEINGTPALATGFGVETKATRFAQFLKEQLSTEEKEEE